MEWTTEKPTKAGLYWVWDGKERSMVEVREWRSDSQLSIVINDNWWPLSAFSHFMGPLPQPEPPQPRKVRPVNETNMLIQEGRLGKFSISEQLIVCSPHDKILRFMSNFIIIDCTYESDVIEYRAYSSLFDRLDQGQVVPHYLIRADLDFNVTVERMKG